MSAPASNNPNDPNYIDPITGLNKNGIRPDFSPNLPNSFNQRGMGLNMFPWLRSAYYQWLQKVRNPTSGLSPLVTGLTGTPSSFQNMQGDAGRTALLPLAQGLRQNGGFR